MDDFTNLAISLTLTLPEGFFEGKEEFDADDAPAAGTAGVTTTEVVETTEAVETPEAVEGTEVFGKENKKQI